MKPGTTHKGVDTSRVGRGGGGKFIISLPGMFEWVLTICALLVYFDVIINDLNVCLLMLTVILSG